MRNIIASSLTFIFAFLVAVQDAQVPTCSRNQVLATCSGKKVCLGLLTSDPKPLVSRCSTSMNGIVCPVEYPNREISAGGSCSCLWNPEAKACVSTCPEKKLPFNTNGTCTTSCSGVVSDITKMLCVPSCPPDNPIFDTKTTTSYLGTTSYTACVSSCGPSNVVIDNWCRSCNKLIYGKQCVDSCPSGTVLSGNYCICPVGKTLIASTGECVENCPNPTFPGQCSFTAANCCKRCFSNSFLGFYKGRDVCCKFNQDPDLGQCTEPVIDL